MQFSARAHQRPRRVATAEVWGGGLAAAVDGTQFMVQVRSIPCQANPKHFGRKRGATYLNTINDQGVETGGMVLSGTPKHSLYAVELVDRHDGGVRSEVLVSDASSYASTRCSAWSSYWAWTTARSWPAARPEAVAHGHGRRLRPLNTGPRGKIDCATPATVTPRGPEAHRS